MEKLEYTHNNDHVKWCYGRQFSWLLTELLYNPAIPILDIDRKEFKNRYSKKTCTQMFIVLFLIAKQRKQPKSPSIDEYINKMQYFYAIKYYLAIKRETLIHDTIWINIKML